MKCTQNLLNAMALAMVICLTATSARAQFGSHRYQHYKSYSSYNDNGKRTLQKMYAAFHLPMMMLDIDQKYVLNRNIPKTSPYYLPSIDTAIYLNKKSSSSLGVSGGFFYKIAKLNDKQMIALDVSMGINYYQWSFGTVKYSTVDSVSDNAMSLQINLPICLMFKSGGEVSLNPEDKLLFSIGAGFAPTFAGTQYIGTSSAFFKLRPFVMTEVGAHIGIAIKLRATYFPGVIAYIDNTDKDLPNSTENGHLTLTANGSANFVLSLILLPYSNRWGELNY